MGRFADKIRGRYHDGPFVVTATRWWSPAARKASRLAVKVLAYEWGSHPASPVELRGLANVVDSIRPLRTLHSLEEPPARTLYRSDTDYGHAYADWQARMTEWRAS